MNLFFSNIKDCDCENYHEYSEYYQQVILETINQAEFSKAVEMSSTVLSQLDKVKAESQRHKRNSIFIEISMFHVLNHLSKFWEFVLHEKYYKSWCSLQDTLDNLRNVKRFSDHDSALLDFLEVQLKAIESVYPYQLFSSTGVIFEGCNCSICGEDIDSFECCHIQGELYDGEIAIGIIQNVKKFDHLALVEHPEDKRCVVGADDSHPNMLVLRDLGQYILQGRLKPLGFKDVLKVEFDKVNDAYVALKPNQKCFCGSGVKFKKCCRNKITVRHKHYEFIGIGLMHY
ncbi:YecA family protein [Photobacterium damselae]|uniref:YecA family protein n=1 Tax=Photobacterium damselae TaxID=38293 RepID=UPI0039071C9B